MPPRSKAGTEQVEKPQVPVDLRDAFVELVGERWGYFAGRTLKVEEMNDKTEAERKASNEAGKAVRESLKEYHEIVPSAETLPRMVELHGSIQTQSATKEEKAKALNKAREPFQKAVSKLAKGIKYLDNVAIPDSLKEMGHPVQPRFNLAKWLEEAVKPKKK